MSSPAATVTAPAKSFGQLVLWALAGVLILATPYLAYRGWNHAQDAWPTNVTDFDVFYHAGGLIVTDDRNRLYEHAAREEVESPHSIAIGHFFNPPALGMLFTPLTLLVQDDARVLAATAYVFFAICMYLVALSFSRGHLFAFSAAAAVISFLPLYDVIYLGHPSLLYSLFIAAAVVALVAGREGRAGLATGLLVLKPSLLLFPAAFLCLKHRQAAMLAAGAGILLGLVPFLLLGPTSIIDYVDLLWKTRGDAFQLHGEVTGGAALMFNWNGFFARLSGSDPSPISALPFTVVTVILAVMAWRRRPPGEGYLAAVLATLLAIAHLLNYDWVILLPAAIIVASRTRDQTLVTLIVALHLAVNISMLQHWTRSVSETSVMIATPMSFLLLAYLALAPVTAGESDGPTTENVARTNL